MARVNEFVFEKTKSNTDHLKNHDKKNVIIKKLTWFLVKVFG